MYGRTLSLLLLSTVAAGAQNVVSVMAGYLHQVDGEAFLEGKPIDPQPGDFVHVCDGQRLRTGEGLVEMMLSPGSCVRIGPNSIIEMINAGLLSAELRVVKGVAVVDLSDLLEPGAVIIRVGEKGRVEPRSDGVFRLDATPSGPSRVRVQDGKATVILSDSETTVKKGRELGLAAGASPVQISSAPDAVDKWQTQRHDELKPRAARLKKSRAKRGLDPLDAEVLSMATRRPGQSSPFLVSTGRP